MDLANLPHSVLLVIGILFSIAFKILFMLSLYYNAESRNSSNSGNYLGFSLFFPIATGIVCLCNQKNIADKKVLKKSILLFLSAVLMLIAACCFNATAENNKWFDSRGNGYAELSDVTFYDKDDNTYNFDYGKSGYDSLYKNSTHEELDADLCYVDVNGMLYYDKEMNVVIKDNTCCTDNDGNIFYPVNQVTFDKDGSIECQLAQGYYDVLGNAYPYQNVPYFDSHSNKYYYSFNDLKGTYTNVITGESYENEYSYVDEKGYFVYDDEHKFVKQEDSEYDHQFKDDKGNIYYWASSITWDENSKMHDAYDKVIL